MGVINHNLVSATGLSTDGGDLSEVVAWIATLGERYKELFRIIPSLKNSYVTVVMAPDGSKEGWSDSDIVDEIRKQFIAKLSTGYWRWVEIGYGEYGQAIIQGNNHNCYEDAEYVGKKGVDYDKYVSGDDEENDTTVGDVTKTI
jgi:hypothetical protein